MATSLAVPVAYITVLVTALAIFSRVYRRRKLAEKTSFEAWFPDHPSRDLYITLLSAQNTTSIDPASPAPEQQQQQQVQVTDNLIKSALLLRATEDVKRIWRIRDDKAALAGLHQRGLVGDETMARFAAAEKELEAEIVDVVQEANSFKMGWGGMIFATATEMAHAEKTRETVMSSQKIRAREEKRIALRKQYLPNDPSASNALASSSTSTSTPAAIAAPNSASASPAPPAAAENQEPTASAESANNTPPSTSSPTMSTPQNVPAGSGSGSGSGAGAGAGSGGPNSGVSSPSSSGASTPAAASGSGQNSGSNSGTNTPATGAGSSGSAKTTPSKKKGKKK